MLRVREDRNPALALRRRLADDGSAAPLKLMRPRGTLRLAALGLLGLALGAGGAVFTVSMVQAEDDAGIRAFHLNEAANRRLRTEPTRPVYSSASSYAPTSGSWTLPWLGTRGDGRIAHPPVALNPFKRRDVAHARPVAKRRVAHLDTVSGAADMPRSICVRLCDGFHAPLGYLRNASDIKGHEALCQAMNPGIPVKVFRVAAGATSIDDAVAQDGKPYSALPMAYSHEKASDASCRPAIAQVGDRRVSLLRDFTLRPGDSVVLDGKVRTFAGGSAWPYSARDFRDFRSSAELNGSQRRQIDETVGVSRSEAAMRKLHRQMRVREANARDDSYATDAIALRGPLTPQERGPVRMIALPAATDPRS